MGSMKNRGIQTKTVKVSSLKPGDEILEQDIRSKRWIGTTVGSIDRPVSGYNSTCSQNKIHVHPQGGGHWCYDVNAEVFVEDTSVIDDEDDINYLRGLLEPVGSL